MPDREKVIRAVDLCFDYWLDQHRYIHPLELEHVRQIKADALALLKEREAAKPKTIPEELKLKMWNALYAKEDKFEEKYIGTKEQNSWFLIYRSWLQEGFNLAIKAIADWEGG